MAVTIMLPGIAIGSTAMHAVEAGAVVLLLGIIIAFGSLRFYGLLKGGLCLALLGVSIIHGGMNSAQRDHDVLIITDRQEIDATGTVTMAEAMTKGRQRIRFTPDNKIEGQETFQGDWRLILPRRFDPVEPGDQVTIKARIGPPLPQLLPGGFGFTSHAARRGFAATGFISDVTKADKSEASIIAVLRHSVQSRLETHLGPDEAAVASAVLVGLRGLTPPDLRENFRASGLAHLLAISGLHMALFCGGVVFLVRAVMALIPNVSSRYAALKIAAAIALPTGAAYLLLAGMPISAIRAFGMMVLLIIDILMDRRGLTLHHVALMALFLLVLDPAAINDPAFQMSFAAVFALVAGWFLLQGLRLKHARFPSSSVLARMGRYVGGIMMASVLASAASTPFVLHHFGVTTAWSVLANVIGMPLMALIVMPSGALALLLMPLGLESLALWPMELGLTALIYLAGLIEGLPLSALRVPPPSGLTLLLLTLSALLPFILSKRMVIISIIPLLTAGIIWIFSPVPVAAVISLHARTHAMVMDADDQGVASSENRFARSILQRPFGVNSASLIDDSGHACHRGYCLITMKDNKYAAIVFARHAMTQACRDADLVIAFVEALYPCRGEAVLIDRHYLAMNGGVLIYNRSGKLLAESINKHE